MAEKIKLNKVELTRLRRDVKTYQQFLPVLKLKQEQLQAKQLKIRRELEARRAEFEAARQGWQSVLPLLAEPLLIDLGELVKARELEIGSKTIAGVMVPTLQNVRFSDVELSRFGTPRVGEPRAAAPASLCALADRDDDHRAAIRADHRRAPSHDPEGQPL